MPQPHDPSDSDASNSAGPAVLPGAAEAQQHCFVHALQKLVRQLRIELGIQLGGFVKNTEMFEPGIDVHLEAWH